LPPFRTPFVCTLRVCGLPYHGWLQPHTRYNADCGLPVYYSTTYTAGLLRTTILHLLRRTHLRYTFPYVPLIYWFAVVESYVNVDRTTAFTARTFTHTTFTVRPRVAVDYGSYVGYIYSVDYAGWYVGCTLRHLTPTVGLPYLLLDWLFYRTLPTACLPTTGSRLALTPHTQLRLPFPLRFTPLPHGYHALPTAFAR